MTMMSLNQEFTPRTNKSYVMLTYDIPSDFDFANPSGRLRRCGIRRNLSCWIIPTTAIPDDLLAEFDATEGRIDYCLIEFAEHEIPKIKELARKALTDEVVRIHTSLIDSIANAKEAWDKAEYEYRQSYDGDKTLSKIYKQWEGRTYQALRNAGQALNAAIESATLFDETECISHLTKALRQAIASATVSYQAEQMAKKGMVKEGEYRGERENRQRQVIRECVMAGWEM